MDFSGISEPDLFNDVIDTVNTVNDDVIKLRLKKVGVKEFTEKDEALLNIKNNYISSIYEARNNGTLTEQVQIDAEARMVMQEAELYLNVESADITALKSIYSKLKALVDKLGGRATHTMHETLSRIEAKLKIEPTTAQANSQASN